MKSVLFTALLVLSSLAQADGFKCVTESGFNIKVFNKVDPNQGTRSGAVMIVSDGHEGLGNRTIATFQAAKNVLQSRTLAYTGKVDLRLAELQQKNRSLVGVALKDLAYVQLIVDFSYFKPVPEGTKMAATLTLFLRNNERVLEDVVCTRYLKN